MRSMNAHEPRFARIAAMIGDPTRSRMLLLLLDGAMLTAGEIARSTGVTPQTASAHLAKLVDAELVAVRAQGRHRYFKLADGDVAHALEALAVVADKTLPLHPTRSAWSRDAMKPLCHARTCYGHLAGQLGVCLHDTLVEQKVIALDGGRRPVDSRWLASIGFDADGVASSARGLAYPCVDWSERRDHFAGPLAVGLLEHFVERRWLVRDAGSRALKSGPVTHRVFDALLARAAAWA